MITDEQLNQKLSTLVTKDEFEQAISGLATKDELRSLRNDMESKFAVVDAKLDALTAAINRLNTMQVVLVGVIGAAAIANMFV